MNTDTAMDTSSLSTAYPLRLIGGQQKKAFTTPQEEYTRFGQGLIVEYGVENNGSVIARYKTPDELCASDEHCSILFKSGTIKDNKLYVCTQTEVLIYSLDDYTLQTHLSLPFFNDLHHVLPTDRGTLLIAVTGLDMVAEITIEGNVIREWSALDEPVWDRFDKQKDYRKVLTTKPHKSHPNFVFEYADNIWVSRFEQRDVLCLTDRSKRIEIGIEKPHDGHVLGNRVYLTTVDGHVVVANLDTLTIEKIVNLHSCADSDAVTGWARGLKIVDKDHVIVGFSTLRVTKFRENIRWLKKQVGMLQSADVCPTHFALYDLKNEKMLWRSYTDDVGLDVIFSIL